MGTCDRKAADYRTAMTKPFKTTLRAFTNMSRCVLKSYQAKHYCAVRLSSKKTSSSNNTSVKSQTACRWCGLTRSFPNSPRVVIGGRLRCVKDTREVTLSLEPRVRCICQYRVPNSNSLLGWCFWELRRERDDAEIASKSWHNNFTRSKVSAAQIPSHWPQSFLSAWCSDGCRPADGYLYATKPHSVCYHVTGRSTSHPGTCSQLHEA